MNERKRMPSLIIDEVLLLVDAYLNRILMLKNP